MSVHLPGTIDCLDEANIPVGGGVSGVPQQLDNIDFGNVCTKVEITKYFDAVDHVVMPNTGRSCVRGTTCTIIESRGYNEACDSLDSQRTVERALRAIYGGCQTGVNCPP